MSVQLRQHEGLLNFKDIIISVVNGYFNRDKDLSCNLLLAGIRYTHHLTTPVISVVHVRITSLEKLADRRHSQTRELFQQVVNNCKEISI